MRGLSVYHVSTNIVEPSEAVFACNLFAKDRDRLALADEPEKVRPKVALIGLAFFLAR